MSGWVNHTTVGSAIFEPLPTFTFLHRYARSSPGAARHAQRCHVLGSDLAGVVLRTGPRVRNRKPGDRWSRTA